MQCCIRRLCHKQPLASFCQQPDPIGLPVPSVSPKDRPYQTTEHSPPTPDRRAVRLALVTRTLGPADTRAA